MTQSLCDTTSITTGAFGANVAWDFRNLKLTSVERTSRFVDPKTTPFSAIFPTATVCDQSDSGLVYYQELPTSFRRVGSGRAGINTESLSDPVEIGPLPVSYLTKQNDNFAGTVTVTSPPASVNRKGTRTLDFDAWGTLRLPNAVTVTNVIRLKITTTNIDSVREGANSIVTTTVTKSYQWIHADSAHPSLQVDSISITITTTFGTSKQINVKQVWASGRTAVTSLVEEDRDASILLFPNPADDKITVLYTVPETQPIQVELVNELGEVVAVATRAPGSNSTHFDLDLHPQGQYFVIIRRRGAIVAWKGLVVLR